MSYSIAIHPREGSYSDRWIARAQSLGIPFELVDCHGSRALDALRPHQGLLWHWVFWDHAAQLMARALIRSAEELGLVVFPSTETCWTYDDKIAQKYHLEALGAPLARTDVFYSEAAALAWLEQASLPVVVKLRTGAGSSNVRLVRTRDAATKVIRQAFGEGFPSVEGPLGGARAVVKKRRISDLLDLGRIARAPRTIVNNWRHARQFARQRGYLYVQEFLPGNAYDVRVTVIGKRAFAFSRNVRPNDFRASGSGSIDYSPERITPECLRIAFDVTRKLRSQSAAYDFVFDERRQPRIVEVSYCYQAKAVHDCPGHWDERLNFVPGQVWPEDAIFDDLVEALARARSPVRGVSS